MLRAEHHKLGQRPTDDRPGRPHMGGCNEKRKKRVAKRAAAENTVETITIAVAGFLGVWMICPAW